MAAKKGYVKNTVKGKQRGKKYPEEVKTACLCALMVNNNICDVARRYNVPESTLRSWATAARKMGPEAKQNEFEKARREQIRAIAHNAASGARLTGEMINRRLMLGLERAEHNRQIDMQMAAAEAAGENDLAEELRAKLKHEIGDYPLANYLRALVSVEGRTAEAGGAQPAAVHITLGPGLEDMGE